MPRGGQGLLTDNSRRALASAPRRGQARPAVPAEHERSAAALGQVQREAGPDPAAAPRADAAAVDDAHAHVQSGDAHGRFAGRRRRRRAAGMCRGRRWQGERAWRACPQEGGQFDGGGSCLLVCLGGTGVRQE